MNTLEKIRFLRFSNHLSQKEVADKIGLNPSNYCYYESGKWKFTIEHIKKIADFYNVSVSYLVNDQENDILITVEQLNTLVEAKKVIDVIESSYNKNEQIKDTKKEK